MGQRGPRKTPAATKKRRGTYRADRDAEPAKLKAAAPPIPKGLHEIARAEWERLAPLAVQKGLLTEADWIAWRMGFEALSTYFIAADLVEAEGSVLWTDKGYPVQHPMVSIGGRAWGSVLKFCREFGLTPSSRTGLAIDDGETEDEFASHVGS